MIARLVKPIKSTMKSIWRTNQNLPGSTGWQSVCLLLFFIASSNALCAQTDSQPVLQIATWDISLAEESLFSQRKKKKKTAWRHTFGSERKDARKTRLGVFNLDVDVVLLQGVRDVRSLRQVFPRREWRLILSRDYLRNAPTLSRLPFDLQAFDIAAIERVLEQPVTVVAVRYQRRLRVRAIRHIKNSNYTDQSDPKATRRPSATAVRLNYFGSTLWLMSLDVVPHCQQDQSSCDIWQAAEAWYRTLNNTEHVLAIAGRSPPRNATASDDQTGDKMCGSFRTLSQLGLEGASISKTRSLKRKKLGCIVLTDITVRDAP